MIRKRIKILMSNKTSFRSTYINTLLILFNIIISHLYYFIKKNNLVCILLIILSFFKI